MAGNSNSKADEVEDKIPDAGLRAWSQCAGSFFLLFNSFGLSNSFGKHVDLGEKKMLLILLTSVIHY